jgi:hypothetical protein
MTVKNASNIYYVMKLYFKWTKHHKVTEIVYIVYTSKLRIKIIQVYLLVLMIRTVTLYFVFAGTMERDSENKAYGHPKLGGWLSCTQHTAIAPYQMSNEPFAYNILMNTSERMILQGNLLHLQDKEESRWAVYKLTISCSTLASKRWWPTLSTPGMPFKQREQLFHNWAI